MTEIPQPKPSEHLIDIVLNRPENMPSYALLLGAGASWNSGIMTANEMIEEWRRQLYEHSGLSVEYITWITKQSWYDSDDEYAELFERIYDLPPQRRDYIERCVDNAHPTWGYIYLTSLLENNFFNTVFTTNFDDLINESCYLYSEGVRPMVCAHDSEVSNVRITKRRVKIIKLHGDFLFDNIKNILGETDRLETNMASKLAEFGREYGLVVIGYGGRDHSVMSILEKLLNEPEYFRHGVYWCLRANDTPRKRVQDILKRERVQAITIEGFDEFMALMAKKAGLELPASLINPLKVAEQRSRVFCSPYLTLLENEIIGQDSKRVLAALGKEAEKPVKGKYVPPEELPTSIKAAIMKDKGDLTAALPYMELAAKEHKDDPRCAYDLAETLARLGKKDELKAFVLDSPIDDGNKTYFLLFTGDDNLLIDFASGILDKEPSNLYSRINRAIAYKRLGNTGEMNSDLKILKSLQPIESIAAGIAALEKNKGEMFRLLDIALSKKLISLGSIPIFPVFEDYREDAEFQKFLEDRKTKRQ